MSDTLLLSLSWLAYLPPDDIRKALNGEMVPSFPVACGVSIRGLENFEVIDQETGAFCIQSHKDHAMFLFFKGSSDLKDLLTDAEAWQEKPSCQIAKTPPGCRLHTGFCNTYQQVATQCAKRVAEFAHKDPTKTTTVYCTGHSLAGAIGTICAMDIALKFPNAKVLCTTFGSPAVGNEVFAGTYAEHVKHSRRVVNEHDPVPAILRCTEYVHVHDEVKLVSTRKRSLTAEFWHWLFGSFDISEHRLASYRRAMGEI